jgi:hypothetical protein
MIHNAFRFSIYTEARHSESFRYTNTHSSGLFLHSTFNIQHFFSLFSSFNIQHSTFNIFFLTPERPISAAPFRGSLFFRTTRRRYD